MTEAERQAAALERIADALEKIAVVAGHRTAPVRERRRSSESAFLTKRAAARRLGVDRATTLADLIQTGALRTVKIMGKVRVPAAELERVAKVGLPLPAPSRSTPVRAKSAGAAIRSIDVEALARPASEPSRTPHV